MSQEPRVDEEFRCVLESSELLLFLLKSIEMDRKGHISCWTASNAGLKVTVEKNNFLQAKAFLKKTAFDEFHLTPQKTSVEFLVNLALVNDCLSIFGDPASVMTGGSTAGTLDTGHKCHLELVYCTEGEPLAFLYVILTC